MNNLLQNIENKFKGIEFNEEKHLYSVNGSPLNTSVSGRIKQYYTPFNAQEIAENKSKRTGVPAEDYLKEWKEINLEAITRGSRVHLFGEKYPYNKSLVPSCTQEEAVVKFWNSLPEHIILVGTLGQYLKTPPEALSSTKLGGALLFCYRRRMLI